MSSRPRVDPIKKYPIMKILILNFEAVKDIFYIKRKLYKFLLP